MLASVLLLIALPCSAAWATPVALPAARPLQAARSAALHMSTSQPENDGEGLPDSSVDWDGAWKDELAKRKTGVASWRPEGREPPSDEQILEAKAKVAVPPAATAPLNARCHHPVDILSAPRITRVPLTAVASVRRLTRPRLRCSKLQETGASGSG